MAEYKLVPLERLKLSEDNARQLGPGDVTGLVASIKALGLLVPILVTEINNGFDDIDYAVVDGQRRMTAAREAGLTEAPVIVLGHNERLAEIGVATNMQRAALSSQNVAQAAGHVLTKLGFKLDDVAAQATIKRSAAKLMKMPELIEAAAACGVKLDRFIAFGALSTLEPKFWEIYDDERTRLDTLGVALRYSPAEREKVLAAVPKGGWLETRAFYALRGDDVGHANKDRALFSKLGDLDETSDLFGGTGRLTKASSEIFMQRQLAVVEGFATDLGKALGMDEPVEIEHVDRHSYASPGWQSRMYGAMISKKSAGEAMVKAKELAATGILTDRDKVVFEIEPDGGVQLVWRVKLLKAGSNPDDPEDARISPRQLAELFDWLRPLMVSVVGDDPKPMLSWALMIEGPCRPSNGGPKNPLMCYADESPLGRSYGGYLTPWGKEAPDSAETILTTGLPGLARRAAGAMLRNVNACLAKQPEGFTVGFRHLLSVYDICPSVLFVPSERFLAQLPREELEAYIRDYSLKREITPSTTKGLLAKWMKQLLGDKPYWPRWASGFTAQGHPQLAGRERLIDQTAEEDEEHVDPAAQPEVAPAHTGDTPGGHTGPADGPQPVEDDWC